MVQRGIRVCALAFLFALCAVSAMAQQVTGSIAGYVRDTTGAAIPKAHVVATEVATNVKHTTVSDNAGFYNVLSLPPGRYRLTIDVAGFKAASVNDIDLQVNAALRFDIPLQVGSVDQTVSVEANAVMVQTSSTALGTTIESREMLALPLNGRSYLDLLAIQPGVAPTQSSSAATDRGVDGTSTNNINGTSLNTGTVSVNGQPESANAFLVNGGDVSETKNMGAGLIPNIDSVLEFRLLTNSFDAQYGKFTGAVVNTITKSGTNRIHGSAFEFYRNDAMDAQGYFNLTKPKLTRNQFGYAVGGPIWKDRLFWFTDYQGSRQTQGANTGSITILSNAMRQGASGAFAQTALNTQTLANAPGVIGPAFATILSNRLPGQTVLSQEPYDFNGCNSTAYVSRVATPLSCVFPGGTVPTAAFDPISAAYFPFIPTPTTDNTSGGTATYSNSTKNNTIRDDKAGQRIDFANHKTGNWSFYYHFDDSTAVTQFPSGYVPGFAYTTPARAQMFMVSNTKTIGSTMVNEARATWFRTASQADVPDTSSASPGNNTTPAQLGFTQGSGLGIYPSGPAGYPVYIPTATLNEFSVGNQGTNMRYVDNNYMVTDTLSKVAGTHSLSAGGEYRFYQLDVRNVCSPTGQFSFSGNETGQDFADFLLGAPSVYVQCSEQLLDNRSRYGALFAQDSWKVTPSLTLNAGVRWDVPEPWYDRYSQLNTFIKGVQSTNFPLAPLGYLVPGDPGVPRSISPIRWNNFGPRIGLAYSPSSSGGFLGKLTGGPGKTSIRASFGIYYLGAADSGNFGVIGSAPWGQYWTSIQPTDFGTPFQNRSDGGSQTQRFPFTVPHIGDPANAHLSFAEYEPVVGPGYAPNNETSYADHYNLSIQRQLSSNTVLTIAYVGTQGHRLQGDVNLNVGSASLCAALAAEYTAGHVTSGPKCGPNQEKATYVVNDPGSPVNGTTYGTLQGMGNQALGAVAFGKVHLDTNFASSSYNSLQVSVERRATRDVTLLGAYTYSKSIDSSTTTRDVVNNTNKSRVLSPFDLTHNFVVSYTWAIFDHFNLPFPRLTKGWQVSGISRFSTGFPVTLSQSGDLAVTGFTYDFPNWDRHLTRTDPRKLTSEVQVAGPSNNKHRWFSGNTTDWQSEQAGIVGNSGPRQFHGPGLLNTDAGLSKSTPITHGVRLDIRGEFFNVFNHTQFAAPAGNIGSTTFGTVTNTIANSWRIGQVSAKVVF